MFYNNIGINNNIIELIAKVFELSDTLSVFESELFVILVKDFELSINSPVSESKLLLVPLESETKVLKEY